jgi:hypothetical protein
MDWICCATPVKVGFVIEQVLPRQGSPERGRITKNWALVITEPDLMLQ